MSDRRATVTVNNQSAYRTNEYYRAELSINNASAPVYVSVTNKAVQGSLSNSVIGNVYLPKTPELFAYDDDGNLLSDGRWDLTWDSENRLTNVVSFSSAPTASKRKLEFTYDHYGRRIQKIVSVQKFGGYATEYTRKFLYDGWNLVAELDETNGLVRSYVWGSDLSGSMQGAGGVGGLLSTTVHTGTNAGTYFYSYDGNGNVAGLVNASSGAIAAEYEYGPFGELIRATGSMAFANPFRFSTKYTDDETDFVYYGYRFYSPSIGRWLSRDPIAERGGLNLCAFVNNEPLSGVDYLGLVDIGEGALGERVVNVGKCEIAVYFGHGGFDSGKGLPDPSFMFPKKSDGCPSGGGFLGCKAGLVNETIPKRDGVLIPGSPNSTQDEGRWKQDVGPLKDAGIWTPARNAMLSGVKQLVNDWLKNKKACCPKVTVAYLSRPSKWTLWGHGVEKIEIVYSAPIQGSISWPHDLPNKKP